MLEPSADKLRKWSTSVAQFMIDYLEGLRRRPVYRHTSSREIRSRLDPALPVKGTDFDSLLNVFQETIVRFSRQNAHPRMLGYIQSPGTPIAVFADLLASTLNANLTIWRSAPAPVDLERLTINWIRQILGFKTGAGGLFVSGGSMANLIGIAMARQTKDYSSAPLRLYASSETHFSVAKAAALLGIGRENVRHVAVDGRFRSRTDDLVATIIADREAGYVPFCVVANAGTVNTGAIDPLAEIRETADHFQLWMHVDGSYGAFVYSRNRRENCSKAWSRQTRSPWILTNGFISRWMLAA